MVDTTDNYKDLALAVVQQAYLDLVEGYEKLLALKYPNHSDNTRIMYRRICGKFKRKDKEGVYSDLKEEIKDCVDFFRTPAIFQFYFITDADTEKIIKSAMRDAVLWFMDRDTLMKNRHEKQQEKVIKAYLRKRKAKEKKKNVKR